MSWLYSQALVAEFLEANSLDGEPCAQLNVMPTQRPFWRKDKTMDVLSLSPFGATWKPLTARRGEELLTWYLAGFHARTSALLDLAPASMVRAADCGVNSNASLARYDHDTHSWRTPQLSLLGGSELYSETWPRWGLMRDGECWEQSTLAPRTNGTESGLWQTPVADDAINRLSGKFNSRGEPKLSAQVKMWPTPDAHCWKTAPRGNGTGGGEMLSNTLAVRWPKPRANDAEKRGNFDAQNPRNGLPAAVKRYMTPTASIGTKCGGRHKGKADTLASQIADLERMQQTSTGQLNPPWVEWLMGWPIGWTDLKPLAMAKFHEWQQQHGGF